MVPECTGAVPAYIRHAQRGGIGKAFATGIALAQNAPGANAAPKKGQTMYDEMYGRPGEIRAHYGAIDQWLRSMPPDVVEEKRREADLLFHRVGITFAVYGDEAGDDLSLIHE